MDSDIPIRFQTLAQGMHVVSGRVHYFVVSPNIIWLSWQRPLTNRKSGTYRLSAPKALSYNEKIAKTVFFHKSTKISKRFFRFTPPLISIFAYNVATFNALLSSPFAF